MATTTHPAITQQTMREIGYTLTEIRQDCAAALRRSRLPELADQLEAVDLVHHQAPATVRSIATDARLAGAHTDLAVIDALGFLAAALEDAHAGSIEAVRSRGRDVRTMLADWLSRTMNLTWAQGSASRRGSVRALAQDVRMAKILLGIPRVGEVVEVRDGKFVPVDWVVEERTYSLVVELRVIGLTVTQEINF